MTYVIVAALVIASLWIGRLVWGSLQYWGTPVLAVYFRRNDPFAPSQAQLLESIGQQVLGAGRAWTGSAGKEWFRVMFVLDRDDKAAAAKIVSLLPASAFLCGAVLTAKPAGTFRAHELTLPTPDIAATELGEEDDEWDDEEQDAA